MKAHGDTRMVGDLQFDGSDSPGVLFGESGESSRFGRVTCGADDVCIAVRSEDLLGVAFDEQSVA